MNHILPKALKERHFISYSVLTVSYYLMLGHTSGVPVANEVYAFLLVNEEIWINCHQLYQSLQRLPTLYLDHDHQTRPDQFNQETYWSVKLLHTYRWSSVKAYHNSYCPLPTPFRRPIQANLVLFGLLPLLVESQKRKGVWGTRQSLL